MDSTHIPKHRPLMEYYCDKKTDARQNARHADCAWLDTLCSQPVDEILRKYHVCSEIRRPQAATKAASYTRGEMALLHAWKSNTKESRRHRQDHEVQLAGNTAGNLPGRLDVIGDCGAGVDSNGIHSIHQEALHSNMGIPNEEFLRPVITSCTLVKLPPKATSTGSKGGDTKQRRNFRIPRLKNNEKKKVTEQNDKIEELYPPTPETNETSSLDDLIDDEK